MPKKGNIVAGVAAGVIAGAVAGLLLAPKAGRESRRVIKEGADTIKSKASGAADAVRQRVRRRRQENTHESHTNSRTEVVH